LITTESPEGTTPEGAQGEIQAATWVREMFSTIAPRYDLLNHLLSFNVDRGWRKALLRALAPATAKPDAKILDLCCGTGDVLLDLQSVSESRILGADFCHPMLIAASHKAQHAGFPAPLFEADALGLPLREGTLDAISIAFGFRNLASYARGFDELRRVLKPGGTVAILEFSHPPNSFLAWAYGLYSRVALPKIGAMVSGSSDAYHYLPESIRKFPKPEKLEEMMRHAGFIETRFELLTGGIAALHVGTRR
jgi:demethylmenaquinone methyltransferase/2-methoxy-6-polyprenyl-1,4-benzoquinol methylase